MKRQLTLVGAMALVMLLAIGTGADVVATVDGFGRIQLEVDSSSECYYVLYVRPDPLKSVEWPVSVTLGEEGKTILTEQLEAYPVEHYRVAEYLKSSPADTDHDGVDDVTEVLAPGGLAPLNPAEPVNILHGAITIPDRATFEQLSYVGENLFFDAHLENLEYVKFYILSANTANPQIYFMNTNTHQVHGDFAEVVGFDPIGPGGDWLASGGDTASTLRGEIVYHPNVLAANGTLGVYRFEFEPNDAFPFHVIERMYELLAANMQVLDNNLAYFLMPNAALPRYQLEQHLYDASRVSILVQSDVYANVGYIPLNAAEGYGLLRQLSASEQPSARDIVIYDALPNEMSRVGGIITTVPQTPLSHVNLRAIQDSVPNAYIGNALSDASIQDLIGTTVYYRVDADGYEIREATLAEAEEHMALMRPAEPQTPVRDLTTVAITDLDDILFSQWSSFGVKAANLAALRTFNLPSGAVPDGYAVPFYFYDEFMKYNGFYNDVAAMLADPEFRESREVQEERLKDLRKKIKKGRMPEWMWDALTDLQAAFPDGTSIRCRSSTNNEDLPGFNGAGLYDSKTQHPNEGHISKSIKQVYASLWNFRAFEERQFYRVDHFQTAMGVLVHPNFSNELANGVGVTTDPIGGATNTYYLNTQLGEDLVTNPNARSVPEEILLGSISGYTVVRHSNLVESEELLLSEQQLAEMRRYLSVIHNEFRRLYDAFSGDDFAMEVEYKITDEGRLVIKQARPWVFSSQE